MPKLLISAAIGLALGATLLGAPAIPLAGEAARPTVAPPPPSKDPAAAPAGTYTIDRLHQSVVARAGHSGLSFNVMRFDATEGVLVWNPAQIESSKLTVTVNMKPITAPIVYQMDPGVPALLNLAKFPTATFTSTSIRRTGPATGEITGDLAFRGQTHPVTIRAELVGAGKDRAGVPTIGFTGVLKLKRSEFGFTGFSGPSGLGEEIDVQLDAEFNLKTP